MKPSRKKHGAIIKSSFELLAICGVSTRFLWLCCVLNDLARRILGETVLRFFVLKVHGLFKDVDGQNFLMAFHAQGRPSLHLS